MIALCKVTPAMRSLTGAVLDYRRNVWWSCVIFLLVFNIDMGWGLIVSFAAEQLYPNAKSFHTFWRKEVFMSPPAA